MRFGFAVPSYGEHVGDCSAMRDLLVAGDELGFDSAWFPDHIAVPEYAAAANLSPPFLEPLSTCAWGLALTRRISLGTDILVAPYRHPLLVAAITGTLSRLAGDRLILGVGIGYLKGEFEALGASPYDRRDEVTDDFLRVQRSDHPGLSVISGSAAVPLWIGGNGTAAQRRAALLGDGWHPLWMPADTYRHARQHILKIREAADLKTPFTFSYSCDRTRLLVGSRSSWQPPPPRPPKGSEFGYAPRAWVDDDNRPRFVGTPDQVISDLRLLEQAGVDHVTLRFASTDIEDLERFVAEVRPALGS